MILSDCWIFLFLCFHHKILSTHVQCMLLYTFVYYSLLSMCCQNSVRGRLKKILSIRKEPMLSGFLTLNAQSILPQSISLMCTYMCTRPSPQHDTGTHKLINNRNPHKIVYAQQFCEFSHDDAQSISFISFYMCTRSSLATT